MLSTIAKPKNCFEREFQTDKFDNWGDSNKQSEMVVIDNLTIFSSVPDG